MIAACPACPILSHPGGDRLPPGTGHLGRSLGRLGVCPICPTPNQDINAHGRVCVRSSAIVAVRGGTGGTGVVECHKPASQRPTRGFGCPTPGGTLRDKPDKTGGYCL